jgi:anti-anti-sigma factor
MLCHPAAAMIVESSVYLVGDVTVMKVRGRIEGADLETWATALETAGLLGQGPLVIDLDGLEYWSLSAQSFLLAAARRAARQGRQLVLCRPSAELRQASAAMQVFDRLTTYQDPAVLTTQLHLPELWSEPPARTKPDRGRAPVGGRRM